MKRARTLVGAAVLVAVAVGVWSSFRGTEENQAMASDAAEKEPMLVHDVFFTTADTPQATEKLVAACDKYLTEHPDTVFYACGTLADLEREVNDLDWDVGLHIVFKDRAAHDTYQSSDRHTQFIEENKSLWQKVRVFDTRVAVKE